MSRNNKKSTGSPTLIRLLGFAKPYTKEFVAVFALILVITGINLMQPKIIQIAIDDYIDTSAPFYETTSADGVSFNGLRYSKERPSVNGRAHYLLQQEEGFYLSTDPDQVFAGAQKVDSKAIEAFRQDDFIGVLKLALFYLAMVLIGFGATYAQVYLLNQTGQKIVLSIREKLYHHLLHLNMQFFDKNPMGNLVTRMTNDTDNLNEMFTSVLSNTFRDSFTLIGIVIIMFAMDYRLALFVVALTPIIVFGSIVFRKHIQVVYHDQRRVLSDINNQLSENISGMRMIQILNVENRIYDEFDHANQAYYRASRAEVRLFSLYTPGVELIRALGIAALIYFGGKNYLDHSLSFGVLYAFIVYIQQFFKPILGLTETYNVVQSAMTSSSRIFHLMDTVNPISNPEKATPLRDFRGKVEFKNVWFAYNDEEWILKDVSFVIEPGEFVAFVGATGAGKSSVINLISRFYDVQKGEILIDDRNIREYDITELRKHIGVVQQDVFLFAGTICDNIQLGNPAIDASRVRRVAEQVNANHFIERLPDQYNAAVMERGATFSAGERQLLSFARTLAQDPPLLVLDEATANIDTETEGLIQDALFKMVKGRTTIAIAHRISTIAHADNIIVLDHGRVAETGSHEELLHKDGLFRVLYDLQYTEDDERS